MKSARVQFREQPDKSFKKTPKDERRQEAKARQTGACPD
jgi:hypothetical protein